jgi:cation:H+ antiporter
MITAVLAIIIGFIGLIWSADRFVAGAAGIANHLGMSPMMIGLTVVAFGTSAPEIVVAISAASEGAGGLAVGNAIGSNLANIGLVLGITALVSPIPAAFSLLKRELPILLIATLGTAFLLLDNNLSFIDGIILLTSLIAIIVYLVRNKVDQPTEVIDDELEASLKLSTFKSWGLFALGLALLIISSEILVSGAKDIALALGISELVIGLTIVAVGTSLPELAATIASALKGHHDIALGNVVGSNLFNLLAVLAMPALINPPELTADVFNRDYMAMTAITVLLILIVAGHKLFAKKDQKKAFIGRTEGTLLLLAYAAYYYALFAS